MLRNWDQYKSQIYCIYCGFFLISQQFPQIVSNEDNHQVFSLDRNSYHKWTKKQNMAERQRQFRQTVSNEDKHDVYASF